VGILFAALAVAFVVSTSIGYWLFGQNGVRAALVGFFVCLTAGVVAEILQVFTSQVLMRVLIGMMLRMSFPMAACLLLVVSRSSLVDYGVVYQLMAFYFVTLIVESWMAIRQLNRPQVSGSI